MDKKKIKILMISSSSRLGGGTKHMFLLGENLKKQFEIFYAIPNNNSFSYFLKDNNFLSISERKINLLDIINLNKFIINNSIDIIHAHGKGAGIIARISNLFQRKILVYTFHGIHLKCHNFFSRNFYIFYEFCMGRLDSHKIFVSRSEMNYAIKSNIYIGKKNTIIYNGVKNRLIKTLSKESQNNVIFSKVSIISVCRLVDQKNIQEFIQIAQRMQECNFILIGDGPKYNQIKKIIDLSNLKNIYLLGMKKKVFYFLRKSDIYLSTSLYEGLPISIIEAMSVGLPIVATNVTGNIDTIKHGESGYLYKLSDVDMAVFYLRKLVNNNQLRLKMGKYSLERQRNLFSLRNMVNQYINMYENLCENI